VVLEPGRRIPGIADSKALEPGRREELALVIRERALAWAVAWASVEEIDRINILQATLLAMRRAVEALAFVPDEAWIDGDRCPELACAARPVVGGDARVRPISAASILAKTARDAEMLRLHERHPQYRLDRHKGYPTPEHLAALARHGACEVHRRSFAPVRRVLGL
jgi:ribonuclease HII